MREDIGGYVDRPARFLARYVARYRTRHILILSAIVLAVAFSVATQYGVKNLVDALSGSRDDAFIWVSLLILVSLIAADNLLWRVAAWVAHATFVAVTGDIRKDLFSHLTGHAPAYFSSRAVGTVTSRVSSAANSAYVIETMMAWNVIPPCLATLFAVAFLAHVNVAMALVLVVVATGILAAMLYLAMAGQPLHQSFAEKAAQVDGELTDIFGNMILVKAFGGARRELERFDRVIEREMTARQTSLFYLERVRIVHATVTIVLTVAMLAWALRLWQQGAVTAGDVVLVCTLGLSVLHATRDLAVALVDTTQHISRFSEALGSLVAPYDVEDHPHAVPLSAPGTTIAFDHVHFGYPGSGPIFKGLSFEIPEGQRVALIGASGSGKTTIFSLVQRFYEVDKGAIRLNGTNIQHLTQESVRGGISFVPQDLPLFNRTLFENILYARPNASADDVYRAAAMAECDDFIAKLPNGMHTIVGDRGASLSGGQKQRIAIARAFLKDAPIILLDEATSALDTLTEARLKVALDNLMRDRTVIAIAHRLSTIRDFDRILVLDQGRIVEDGTPDTLLRGTGVYSRLLESERAPAAGPRPIYARHELLH